MGQFNSLREAACLVQRWWCEKQPLSLCGIYISFSLSLLLSRSFTHWFSYVFCPSLGQTNESSWSPWKEHKCKSWGFVSCTYTYTHVKQSYCHNTVRKDLRSWVRSVCNNLSRIRQSWWSCDICEHCVPVNAITHYPLSLPAQAEWLHSSLSPSLPFCLCHCHPVHNCTVAFFVMFILYMDRHDMDVSINCFYGNSTAMLTSWSFGATLQLLLLAALMVIKLLIDALQISNKILSYSKRSITWSINIDKVTNNNLQPLHDYALLNVVCRGYVSNNQTQQS